MAVTFDIKDAKKATEVVIEVTEIVSVECFKVASSMRIKSSSPSVFRRISSFGVGSSPTIGSSGGPGSS